MPRETDHEWAVVSVVGGPGGMGGGEGGVDVVAQIEEVEFGKVGRVGSVVGGGGGGGMRNVRWTGRGDILMEDAEIELFGPPVENGFGFDWWRWGAVAAAAAVVVWARHGVSLSLKDDRNDVIA